ncbi:MAG: hypothetical protein C0604_05695, partial [Clostridiales bacterium]
MENKKFFIETLGCSKNQVDSEFLAGSLVRAGLDLTYDFDLNKNIQSFASLRRTMFLILNMGSKEGV